MQICCTILYLDNTKRLPLIHLALNPEAWRISMHMFVLASIDGFQMSIKRPTSGGQCVIKRQLYSEPFTLREAASSIFQH